MATVTRSLLIPYGSPYPEAADPHGSTEWWGGNPVFLEGFETGDLVALYSTASTGATSVDSTAGIVTADQAAYRDAASARLSAVYGSPREEMFSLTYHPKQDTAESLPAQFTERGQYLTVTLIAVARTSRSAANPINPPRIRLQWAEAVGDFFSHWSVGVDADEVGLTPGMWQRVEVRKTGVESYKIAGDLPTRNASMSARILGGEEDRDGDGDSEHFIGDQAFDEIAYTAVLIEWTEEGPDVLPWRAPLRVVQRGNDGHALSGGRRAVQGRTIQASNRVSGIR